MLHKLFISIVCIFLANLFFAHTSYAASTSGGTSGYTLQVNPAIIALHTTQGNNFKTDITIQNTNSYAVNVLLYVNNFKADGGNGSVAFYTPTDSLQNMATWIHPEIPNPVITSQEKQIETIDIHVPTTLADGTYTGVLFIQQSPVVTTGNGASVIGRIGINLIITVSGDQHTYTLPEVITSSFPLFTTTVPVMQAKLYNKSNFIVSENVILAASPVLFQNTKKFSFSGIDILPKSFRYVDGTHPKVLLASLSPGIYRVELSVYDVISHKTQIKSFLVFYIPLYFLFIILFVIVVIIIWLVYALYRRKGPYRYT